MMHGQKIMKKILSLIYPIYNHNWRNIINFYTYNNTSIKIIFLKSNKINRAKELSSSLYIFNLLLLDIFPSYNRNVNTKTVRFGSQICLRLQAIST